MAENNNAKRLLCILEILRKHSDSHHPLSQQDIIRMLRDLYGIKADRKTVKSNILSLIDYGYDVEFTETVREKGTSKENTIASEYYINNEFTDSEIRFLIDSVLFSQNIPDNYSKDMIAKLQKMSTEFFYPRAKYVYTMPVEKTDNREIFMTLDAIDKAIINNKKISYKKLVYDLKEGCSPKKSDKGKEQVYRLSPYQIAMCEGKYYLIGGALDNVIHVDIARIKEVNVLDEEAVSFRKMKNANGLTFNLKDYVNEHIFMCAGKPIRARLKVLKNILYDVIDTFGKNITIVRDEGEILVIDVKAPEKSIEQFLRRYTPQTTILEPEDLKEKFATLFAIATVATKNGRYHFKKSDSQ